MFKKILIPVDGSENSFKAAKTAASMIANSDCLVTIFHVIELPTIHSRPEFTQVLNLLKEDIENEGKKIIEISKSYFNNDKNLTSKITYGQPASEIISESNKSNYDLIVLGSRGLGEFKGIMLGSVSDRVSHNAKASVLIVH